jgi:hypothetical protein
MTTETGQVQHTPGPWHVMAASKPGNDPPRTRYTVYELRGGPDLFRNSTQVAANERLLSAAPDLLAFTEHVEACPDCYCDGICDTAGGLLTTALAKVKGS